MAFDFKKEYREFYLPGGQPEIVTIPPMKYLAVRGEGDPNEEGGAYKAAIGLLYAIAFTIKMSKLTDHRIDGYFDYVVPPLEGFWRQPGVNGFVTKADFDWAIAEATRKKEQDFSTVEFLTIDEGLCVQLIHVGPFDDEPDSMAKMDAFLAENGFENDFSDKRLHHEIYLSDARRVAPEKWKTVLRHPIRRASPSSADV